MGNSDSVFDSLLNGHQPDEPARPVDDAVASDVVRALILGHKLSDGLVHADARILRTIFILTHIFCHRLMYVFII